MDKTLDKIIKKHIVLTVITAIVVACMMITIAYGLYQTNHKNTVDQEIAIGEFDVNLTSNSGQITLADLKPGDEPNTVYTFTTSNSGDYTVAYNVYLTDNTTTFLENGANAQTYSDYSKITEENYQYINYSLDNGEAKPLSSALDSNTGKMTILSGRLQPAESKDHTIKFSISSSAPNNLQGSILALNITMEASASKETGADKILKLVAGANASSTEVITKKAPAGATCTNTLAYDGTTDNNLRYVGANPCNYVSFNGEGWRIVGIMNNVDDGTGTAETRIKLVRKNSIGDFSWDSSEASVNNGYGVNDWTQADLKNELNGDYLDTSLTANTNWYNGSNNAQTGVFGYRNRLSASAQDLIDNAKWYLGGFKYSSSDYSSLIPSTMYTKERGTEVVIPGTTCSGTNCNDGITRATSWTGKVALIYPSDYGYATAGGTTTNRTSCIGTVTTYSWDNSSYSDCKNNDWLKYSFPWLLAPSSNNARNAFYVGSAGSVSNGEASIKHSVWPAVYLKSGVTISGGNGSIENPYTLN